MGTNYFNIFCIVLVTIGHTKHWAKKKHSSSTRDCNFICHIINIITLLACLGADFNNADLDTSFGSIDPKFRTAPH